MPFEIVRNDIVNMQVDAIVNTANPKPVVGSGVDSAIHKAAGPELLKAREAIGDLTVGSVAETPAFNLPAKYVLHTAGPVWTDGTRGEEELLRACYKNTLAKATELGCQSVAFPLISTGNYGFPKDLALQVAIQEFGSYLLQHDLMVYLVVFGEEAYHLSTNLFSSVQSYIDENYVGAKVKEEYAGESFRSRRPHLNAAAPIVLSEAIPEEDFSAEPQTLEAMIDDMDAGFSDTVMTLIDATGKKRADIYKQANISKQVFSKMNSNSRYQPSKPTAIALCFALELNLEETQALLAKAGYTLSNSILFDVVVASFIANENYNVIALNCALFERDLPLIGGKGT